MTKPSILDPKDPNKWIMKGQALEFLGSYNESIKAYEKAIELDPKAAEAWIGKGNMLKALEREG